jgi:hypothetical protein
MVPIKWNLPCFHWFFVNDGKYVWANVCIFFEYFTSDVIWTYSFFGVDVEGRQTPPSKLQVNTSNHVFPANC